MKSPLERVPHYKKIFDQFLPDPRGKRILEIGCGIGELSNYLASRGAKIIGTDVGCGLIKASCALAKASKTGAAFKVASATKLPFRNSQFDYVICMSVLHHLDEQDLRRAVNESYRVLKSGGYCLFNEPIEESALFDFLQNLIPITNKRTGTLRPSILQRRRWFKFLENVDERNLTTRELKAATHSFSDVKYYYSGFTSRLDRIFPKLRVFLARLDIFLFAWIPFLKRYARNVVVFAKK